MSNDKKTAVITGASRGIGLATAKKLASKGVDIAVVYIGSEEEANNAKKGRVLMMDRIIWEDGWPKVEGSVPALQAIAPSF